MPSNEYKNQTKYITLHPYNNNTTDLLPKVADLTININGTAHKYDGSAVMSVDITAQSIGAVSSTDLTKYVTKTDLNTTLATYATKTYVDDAIKAITDNGIVNSVASDTLSVTGTEKTYTSGTTSVTGYNGDIKVELPKIIDDTYFNVVGSGYTLNSGSIHFDEYGRAKAFTNTSTSFVSLINSGSGITLSGGEKNDDGQFGKVTIGLAESGVTANTYGSFSTGSVVLPSITFDKYGRATSATTTTFSIVNTLKSGDGISITSGNGNNTNGYTGNATIALSASGANAGTYGKNESASDSVVVPQIVVDKYGRITSVTNNSVKVTSKLFYRYSIALQLQNNNGRFARVRASFISDNGNIFNNVEQVTFTELWNAELFDFDDESLIFDSSKIVWPDMVVRLWDEASNIVPWEEDFFYGHQNTSFCDTLFAPGDYFGNNNIDTLEKLFSYYLFGVIYGHDEFMAQISDDKIAFVGASEYII